MEHIYNGILLSHKNEWNDAIWSNVNAIRDDHTKWSKSEKERQIPYDITYMWQQKPHKRSYKKETDSQA